MSAAYVGTIPHRIEYDELFHVFLANNRGEGLEQILQSMIICENIKSSLEGVMLVRIVKGEYIEFIICRHISNPSLDKAIDFDLQSIFPRIIELYFNSKLTKSDRLEEMKVEANKYVDRPLEFGSAIEGIKTFTKSCPDENQFIVATYNKKIKTVSLKKTSEIFGEDFMDGSEVLNLTPIFYRSKIPLRDGVPLEDSID